MTALRTFCMTPLSLKCSSLVAVTKDSSLGGLPAIMPVVLSPVRLIELNCKEDGQSRLHEKVVVEGSQRQRR